MKKRKTAFKAEGNFQECGKICIANFGSLHTTK